MRFGAVPVEEAVGALAVHSVRAGAVVVRKGSVVTREQAELLKNAGVATIAAARFEPDDVGEDEAARRLAEVLAGPQVAVERPFTGRANLFARAAGVLLVDKAAVDRLNGVDEAVTAATLPAYKAVVAGEMVGTVKIIPYAVPGPVLADALAAAAVGSGLAVAPYALTRVAVISTLLPGLKASVVDKTLDVLAQRLNPTGAAVVAEIRVAHAEEALAEAMARVGASDADLIIVYGASAIADRRDVIPAALERAGGVVEHFGMPVDPGNLLLVGRLGNKPVIGAPGCARSPKENGFDWVLQRLLADVPVTRADIVGLGVGGLLMEIVSRPQPRAEAPQAGPHGVAALVLAAGQSRRMGGPNKLLAQLRGKPLVRRAVEAALASAAASVTVVTGHQAAAVRAALEGLDVRFAHNPDFADGLSTSLKTGLAALPPGATGAIVCLADMPEVTSPVIDRLIAAFAPDRQAAIVVPTAQGKRGNPVLWARRYFDALADLSGDVGARHLIGAHAEAVTEVEIGPAAALDLDTREAMRAAGGAWVGVEA